MATGVLVAIAGMVWILTGDFDREPTAIAPTTSDPVTTTAQSAPPSTATAPTSKAPTTTTTTLLTTTTTVPVETVEEFLVIFRQALATDDLGFLFERLHPIAKDTFGEELCRAFVDREIAILENYEATAEPGESQQRTVSGIQVEVFDVPVEFDFQGQHFEAVGSFALVDGRVHYFAECR